MATTTATTIVTPSNSVVYGTGLSGLFGSGANLAAQILEVPLYG